MSATPSDPRLSRLAWEEERLLALNQESECVSVEAHPLAPGIPSEKYTVSFRCRTIVGIQADRSPIFEDGTHQVQIYCDTNFPTDVPKLDWLTPIWHPNIKHVKPRVVCVNKAEWLAGMGLDYLCWQMLDMVQWRNYHAQETPPYPQDHEVAKWVREYAEPRNIVNKARGIGTDDKPFFKPKIKRLVKFQRYAEVAIQNPARVRFVVKPEHPASVDAAPQSKPATRIRLTSANAAAS